MKYHFEPIGIIQSDFKEKLGVPRQSGMVKSARAIIRLHPDPDYKTALKQLETFSHIWVVFIFHQSLNKKWTPTIRPPRLDAPERVGVLASRSPHRPNPIGISVVKLEKIDLNKTSGAELHISGGDLLDETPVLDIKPYIPYADSIPTANGGWAGTTIPRYPVSFSEESLRAIEHHSVDHPNLKELLTEMLEWDPRPTPQRATMPIEDPAHQGKEFCFRLLNFDVQYQIKDSGFFVIKLVELTY